MENNQSKPKKYQAPRLEQHGCYTSLVGVSLPIGSATFPDTFELGLSTEKDNQ